MLAGSYAGSAVNALVLVPHKLLLPLKSLNRAGFYAANASLAASTATTGALPVFPAALVIIYF